MEPAGPNQPGRRSVGQKNQPQSLVAKRLDLGLSLRQITEPRHFHSVTLRDGTLNLQQQDAAMPIQADVLQLSNMALQSNDETWQLNAQQVNAGITPWQPKAGHPLGITISSSSALAR